MNPYKKLYKILEKSGGEGSKGGSIIGHTRSGKPIYAGANHAAHQGFNSQEHRDAMNHHHDIWSKTQSKIQNIRTKNSTWNPPKQIHDFLNHHYTQMQRHQGRMSDKLAVENRQKLANVKPRTKPIHPPLPEVVKGFNDMQIPLLSAVVVISPDKKKVLLGKRTKNGEWESPAGHADVGEHPEDVAIRECFEEFGVPLRREQLIKLPMQYKGKDMEPVFCYMAITEKEQIKNITCEDDPSEEHTKWKWYKLDEKLPDAMEDNRFNSIIHAKMELAGIGEMSKSYSPLDETEAMSMTNTAEDSVETRHSSKEQELITKLMNDFELGNDPKEIPVGDSILHLVRVDDGMYSGSVKRMDNYGLLENIANIDKMTIPTIIQFLRAKQILKEEPKVEAPSKEEELKALLQELMPKKEKFIYVSMDGDDIGNKVARAEALDDEDELMEISRKINAGQDIFSTWAASNGGKVIEGGGDEALAKVPEKAKDNIDVFRNHYNKIVGATVTIGVGDSISESTKARALGKLKGKDRVETFNPENTEKDIHDLIKPKDAAQKLRDSGILELTKALLRKSGSLPIGTVRKWDGIKYGKHRDGWVVMEGVHKGKLLGRYSEGENPTHEDFVRYYSNTSIKENKALKKGFTSIIKLTTQLEELSKGVKLPTGSVRIWAGSKFIKQGDGHWMPMGDSTDEHTHPGQQKPQAVNEPQAGVSIPQGSNSTAVVQPRDKTMPNSAVNQDLADQHVGKQPKIPNEHLKREKKYQGGHVSLHEKDLKTSIATGPMSIISAGRNSNNPEDRGMTDEQISTRYKKLEQELKDRGYKYTKVKGHYGAPEDSFAVHHADTDEMDELGEKFNQDSVIHTKNGENKLHYTTGKHKGEHHKGTGHEEVPEAKDFYSEVPTINGKRYKFSLNLDFGKYHKNDKKRSDVA